MTPTKKLIHGGMTVVMFCNQLPAMAQQAVSVVNAPHVAVDSAVGVAIATSFTGLTGSLILVNTNNLAQLPHLCGNYTTVALTTNTTAQMVAGVNGQTIYVCDYDIMVGTTASNINFVIGTGTNCASGAVQLGMVWPFGINSGKIAANPYYRGMNSSAVGSAALCAQSSATSNVYVGVYYDQY
jgi:hypothetical protein